jgi:hypothetical protein
MNSRTSRAGLDGFDALLAVLLLASYVAVAKLPFAPKKFGDLDFHLSAKAISLWIHGAGPWSAVEVSKAPGPVLYYAVPYGVMPLGSSDDAYWTAALVWTVVWMTLALLLTRRACALLGGARAGRLGALLTLLSPFGVYYSYGIGAEAPAFVCSSLFTYGWCRWWIRERDRSPWRSSAWWLSWLGALGLILCRPNAILLLALGALSAWWALRRQEKGARPALRFTAATVLATAATLAAVSASIVMLLPQGWQEGNLSHVILQGRYQFRQEPFDWRFWSKATRQGSVDHAQWQSTQDGLRALAEQRGVRPERVEWPWIAQDLRQHPWLTLRMSGVRLLALNVALVNSRGPAAFRLGPVDGRVVYVAFHVLVNGVNLGVLALAVVYLGRERGQRFVLWPLWAPWLALLFFHVATYAEPRYLFPGRPGLVVMASALLPAFLPRAQRFGVREEPALASAGGGIRTE